MITTIYRNPDPALKPLRTPPTMRELRLAAECLRLKASLFASGVQVTQLEERLRAAQARNLELTAALHRQATCA